VCVEVLRGHYRNPVLVAGVLDAASFRQRIPPALVDRWPLLDPSAINQRLRQQSIDEASLPLALLTNFLDQGRVARVAASGVLDTSITAPG